MIKINSSKNPNCHVQLIETKMSELTPNDRPKQAHCTFAKQYDISVSLVLGFLAPTLSLEPRLAYAITIFSHCEALSMMKSGPNESS